MIFALSCGLFATATALAVIDAIRARAKLNAALDEIDDLNGVVETSRLALVACRFERDKLEADVESLDFPLIKSSDYQRFIPR